tara:strand:- start:61617 stop:62270 length:654 start_codon:yes stop_codon:yes gene_type:complete
MLRKISLGLFSFVFVCLLAWIYLQPNIHVVIPGKVYRSAQPTPGNLSYLVRKEGIRSVINLRGYNPNAKWYQDEMAMSRKLGIKHYSIPMSAYTITSMKNLKTLTYLLHEAPKPILIHCQGGSDRAGLASAVALLLYKNDSLANAKQQVSFHYLVIHGNSTGYQTLPYYGAWLKAHKIKSSSKRFMRWIHQLKPGVNYPCVSGDKNCTRVTLKDAGK